MAKFSQGTANLALPLSLSALVGLAIVILSPSLYQRLFAPDYYAMVQRNDPKVGTQLSAVLADVQSLSNSNQKQLLIFLGSCNSCSINGFEPKRLTLPPSMRATILIQNSRSEIPKALVEAAQNWNIEVLADPDRAIETKFNAVWRPRMYVMSNSGELEWIQPRPDVFPEGVNYDRAK